MGRVPPKWSKGSQGNAVCGNIPLVTTTQTTIDSTPWPEPRDEPRCIALLGHVGQIRSLVAARLGEDQAVDDVVQEIAVAVASNRDAQPEGWGAWLSRISIRYVLIYRRKAGRRHKLIASVAGRLNASDATRTPLDWLIDEERRSDVRTALGRLAPADAEILLLKYRDDLKTHEIARKLGLSESATEARLHRARGRLRAELLGTGVDDASQ